MTPDQVNTILYRLDKQDEVLGEIQHHVSRTNGRVLKLELWQAKADGAKAAMAWLPSIATGVTIGVIVTAVAALLT